MKNCTTCQAQIPDDAIFCDQCGTPVSRAAAAQPEPGACPSCGAPITPGELFCGDCGTPLDAPAPGESQALAATAAEPQPAPATPDEIACPFCGASVLASDDFCFACGAALARLGAANEATPSEVTPEPADATATPLATPAPDPSICPSCGASVIPGEAFCEYCGAALVTHVEAATAPAPAGQPTPAPAAAPVAAPKAHLETAAGLALPLKAQGETLIGREDPVSGIYPDIDLTPHGGEEGGVSRRHCKLRLEGGRYLIEDLNSTNFTTVNKKGLTPGVAVPLNDGDEIRAGRVVLTFRMH